MENGTLIHKTMKNLYVKLEWPEYQAYQQLQDFDEHSHYCSDDDVMFIEQDWINEQDVQDSSTTIDYNGTDIELSSRYVGKDSPPWETDNDPIHHHKVSVKIGSKKHTFDYWSGLAHYKSSTVMSDIAMIEAFDFFLTDCTMADQSIDDFQSELGFQKASECIRTYNACKESLEAWKQFYIDPQEIENWIREKYNL